MPRFHLLTPNLSSADAVSQDVLGMAQALRAERHEVVLYAADIEPRLEDHCAPLDCYESGPMARRDDVLIYHHAIGWPRGIELCRRTRNRRIVRYHNITPATFYAGIHPDYFSVCTEGIRHTHELARMAPDLWLCDSEYSVNEVLSLGIEPSRAQAVPPFHQLQALDTMEADPSILRYARQDIRNILFVGRVAPNKGHQDLIAVFAHYHRFLNPKSRLFIVGAIDPRLEEYHRSLRKAIDRAGLSGAVVLTGRVQPAQLKAYYLVAHAFLCTSHHEGFGVPLVEAMYFKVPCVAWNTTGVSSTLGEEALSWPELDHHLLAESVHYCLEQPEARDYLIQVQRQRYDHLFAPAAIKHRFLSALEPLLAGALV